MPKIHIKRLIYSLIGLLYLLASTAFSETKIAVISDLNGSYGSVNYHPAVGQAIERIVEMQPALVINTGDMIAGQRTRQLLIREELESMWSAFHHKVTKPLQVEGLQMAVTPGNHDGSAYARYHLERKVYDEQWSSNKPLLNFIDDTHYPFYYAFELDGILLVSLDATKLGALDPVQKQWLGKLLSNIGTEFKARILFSHVPLWPFAENRETEALFDVDLEKILHEHNVDLYLSGHHHAYYPGYKDGVRYVSQSCLGSAPRRLLDEWEKSPRSMTLLSISDHGDISVTAYIAPDYTEIISLDDLPESIVSPQATLIREDLADPARQPGSE